MFKNFYEEPTDSKVQTSFNIDNSSNNFNALQVIPENINNELKDVNNWVLFRGVKRKKPDFKWTKPPLMTDGSPAKVT